MRAHVDAVVIGAGAVGSSIAERLLARSPVWRVVLLEKAPAPGTGETRFATGGVRAQFGTEPNVRLSLLSISLFEQFGEMYGINPRFRRNGYLFVTADPARLAIMDRELELQRRLGVESERLDPARAREVCPPIFAGDLLGANYSPLDGSIETAAVLQAYIDTFRRRGGALATDAEVIAIDRVGEEWEVRTPRVGYLTPNVVIACGAESCPVASLVGLDLPLASFARQVLVAAAVPEIPDSIPFTVDMDTGLYVFATGAELMLGGTDRDARPVDAGSSPPVEVDKSLFEKVHNAASHRMPVLQNVQVTRSYAGVQSGTPDHNPILGPVASHSGIFLAVGHSGHGIMHSPAIGALLSEWIIEGRPATWDARPLALERFTNADLEGETAIF